MDRGVVLIRLLSRGLIEVTMTKTARFHAALAGEEVDRPPVSVWLHFASEHLPGKDAAQLHARYFFTYGWDYLKVMHDYRYPLGSLAAVETEADLLSFAPLAVDQAFGEQLALLRELRRLVGPDVPIIDTLFSPMQTIVRAAGMSSWNTVLQYPQAAKHMLEAVTHTLSAYVRQLREEGIDGVFFSTNGAIAPDAPFGMTDEQFATFIAPYDQHVLQAAEGLARIVHVHGIGLQFNRVYDYQTEAFSWSHLRTRPTLTEVKRATGRAVVGGIDEVEVFLQTPAQVCADINATVEEVGGRGLLIGPGCTVFPDTPKRTLHAIAQAVQAMDAQ